MYKLLLLRHFCPTFLSVPKRLTYMIQSQSNTHALTVRGKKQRHDLFQVWKKNLDAFQI